MDNKIAAGEVGKDLKRVADTLVETVTETETTVTKNVSPAYMWTIIYSTVCQHAIVKVFAAVPRYTMPIGTVLRQQCCHLACTCSFDIRTGWLYMDRLTVLSATMPYAADFQQMLCTADEQAVVIT